MNHTCGVYLMNGEKTIWKDLKKDWKFGNIISYMLNYKYFVIF